MTIAQIYDHYRIMPNLQTHMYRVAGVGDCLCDHMQVKVDRDAVVAACLLHDMGNIIKFDLAVFPEFCEPEGLAYWQDVKDDFHAKYGWDEHVATQLIVKEIGVSARVYELINAIGFLEAKENFETQDLAKKICSYADMRVAPHGVVSLEARLADLEQRYGGKYPSVEDQEKRRTFRDYMQKIEKQIFAECDIRPEEITEESVQPLITTLRNFEVK